MSTSPAEAGEHADDGDVPAEPARSHGLREGRRPANFHDVIDAAPLR